MIFLDMDGVLCDFHGRAAEDFGCDVNDFTEWAIWEPMGLTEEEFWTWLGTRSREWWSSLNPYPWAEELVSMVASVDPEYRILSTASKGHSVAGKIDWFHNHFGEQFHRFHFTSQKPDLAARGRLLIDDSDHNCKGFAAKGGDFLCVPQPWNANASRIDRRMEHVRSMLYYQMGPVTA
jgi:hypothetical protein